MSGEFEFDKQPGLKRKKCKNSFVKPLMSIITPFYNAGEFFEQTFNCVINQTFIWFEWIVVDDGSSDALAIQKLKELVKNDSRIKVYRKENGGPAAARNYALTKTNTELIVTLDADDLIEPTYLEENYFALYFNPDAAWAYTDSLGFGELNYVWTVPFDVKKLKKKNFLVNTGVVRKKYFELVGGYDATQKYSHEDWNLWLSIMAQSGYPIHISGLLAWYRIVGDGALHKTNDHKAVKKRAYEHIQETANKITEIIEAVEYPRDIRPQINNRANLSKWNLKLEKEAAEVLIMVPDLNFELFSNWTKEIKTAKERKGVHVGIIATDILSNIQNNSFSEVTYDIFELPSFLDIYNYPEFISYYIKSRQVDMVVMDHSNYGKEIFLWLQCKFPNLYIVDMECSETFDLCDALSQLEGGHGESIPDWKKRCEECADAYMTAQNKVQMYEHIYVDCQQNIEKKYKINQKKKIIRARFLDTKFGSIIDGVSKMVRRKYGEHRKGN